MIGMPSWVAPLLQVACPSKFTFCIDYYFFDKFNHNLYLRSRILHCFRPWPWIFALFRKAFPLIWSYIVVPERISSIRVEILLIADAAAWALDPWSNNFVDEGPSECWNLLFTDLLLVDLLKRIYCAVFSYYKQLEKEHWTFIFVQAVKDQILVRVLSLWKYFWLLEDYAWTWFFAASQNWFLF